MAGQDSWDDAFKMLDHSEISVHTLNPVTKSRGSMSDTSSEYKLYSTGHSIAIAPRRKHGRLPITVCLFSLFVTADLWIYDKEVLTKTTTHRLKCIGYPLLVFLTGLGIFANIGFLLYNLQALLRCRSERRSTTPPQMTIMSHSCLPLKQRTNP
jgi:hypothetical protein